MSDQVSASEAALAQLAEAIGMEAATTLAREFGGTQLYVPKSPGEHHPIRAVLGEEATARLAAWSGGGRISIPKLAKRRQQVLTLRRVRAWTVSEIARKVDLSERQVYRICAAGRDETQLDLFPDF
ncbi:MAG: sigma factor-like helix-turn-helix DNA-binding protein [Novosphingobium sp.]